MYGKDQSGIDAQQRKNVADCLSEEEFKNLLFGRGLTIKEKQVVWLHLDACKDCQEEYEELKLSMNV